MDFKYIDMSSYPRRDHFEHFRNMDCPFATMTVQVEITDWLRRLKAAKYPMFLCFQYAVAQAANQVPEFRQRIREDRIVEYDFCNPSYTVDMPDGTYRLCMVNANQPLESYLSEAKVKQEAARQAEHLQEEGDVQSLLFVSCVPWQPYTGCTMPYPNASFSIPNIVWGKFQTEKYLALEAGQIVEKEKTTIPVTVFINHALIDGRHIAAFFSNLTERLADMAFLPKAREGDGGNGG